MLERLNRRVEEIGTLQSKLVLLVGTPGAGKTALLRALANHRRMHVLNAGVALGGLRRGCMLRVAADIDLGLTAGAVLRPEAP